MRPLRPVVLENVILPDFLQYLISCHEGPSTIVVCSNKDTFLDNFVTAQLNASSTDRHGQHETEDADDTSTYHVDVAPELPSPRSPIWSPLTLHQLAASRDIQTVFCPDTTHLRAFLAMFSIQNQAMSSAKQLAHGKRSGHGILAVLNPIQIHRHTSAFSAQGLTRTLAIAVEAAHLTGKRLLIAECPVVAGQIENVLMSDDTGTPLQTISLEHPWEQEVSILNVTTKSFGTGERGWVGRTVKLRAIAERWCTFTTVDMSEPRE